MATTEEMVIAFPSSTHGASFAMNYERFLEWEHDGIAEWVDGRVYLYMSTKLEHQKIVDFLNRLLGLFVQLMKLGVVTTGPYAMRAVPNGPGREPDLMFVAQQHLARMTSKQLEGPADLVVEVVSDDSVVRDRDEKFFEYQQASIREYWIVDPRPNRLRADFYVLDEQGTYQAIPIGADGVYRSTVLLNFWFKVGWLWDEVPNPLAAFTQIVGAKAFMASFPQEEGSV
ncbi:Uma2 family endonuclease [Candidatus Gracilibacteria bacterium]|nr:Uma2 family endonuclease [Candidatus Gracilibacteria bacterium]